MNNVEPIKSFHLVWAPRRAEACAQPHYPAYLSTSAEAQDSAGSSSIHPAIPPVWCAMEHVVSLLTATLATVLRYAPTGACAALGMLD